VQALVPGLLTLGVEGGLEEWAATAASSRRPPRLSVNGCILLQALLAMPQSACRAITDEALTLAPEIASCVAADPSGAHVFEALLKVCAAAPHALLSVACRACMGATSVVIARELPALAACLGANLCWGHA
jgi:hypothetical protein